MQKSTCKVWKKENGIDNSIFNFHWNQDMTLYYNDVQYICKWQNLTLFRSNAYTQCFVI